jgi:hypothetical protein
MGVMMLPKAYFAFLAPLFIKKSSGARPALPMGVAPEAIVEKLISSIDSSILCLLNSSCILISLGACSALPMVVAPEAIVEYFRV